MARRRCSVAVVPPPAVFAQLQAVRRLVGDPRVEVLAPHVTLVAPVDLPADEVDAAARAVRAAARATRPFELRLGPAASFAPATPTLHLVVGGDVGPLAELRDAVRRPPLDRPDRRGFVPHLTLRRSVDDPAVLAGALAAMTGGLGPWSVDRVVLLEHRPVVEGPSGVAGPRRWRVIAEEPFGAPAVVGRGGVELELRTVGVVEPAVAELCGVEAAVDTLGARDRFVAVAERAPDGVVGALTGRLDGGLATIDALAVAEGHRSVGVGRHLVERWCTDAARSGARIASASTAVGGAAGGALAGCGFSEVGDRLLRLLRPGGTD